MPRTLIVAAIGSFDDAPVDAGDVYLRLHLLSTRRIRPHGANLDGIFGAARERRLDERRADRGRRARAGAAARPADAATSSPCTASTSSRAWSTTSCPSGVRIADADRVRLGAHLAEGTTVMHEGFVNFNAGTLGASMVEGRISAGVVIGDGTDVGGGASIMGTLSGGNEIVISVGERCLLGANSGLGIPLGDDCTRGVRALPDGGHQGAPARWRQSCARASSRASAACSSAATRRRGAVEAHPRAGAGWHGLNAALHAN